MKRLLTLALLLCGCEAARSSNPVVPDDVATADTPASDVAQDATPTADAAADTPDVAASDVAVSTCPTGNACDDGDPCTVEDLCGSDGCKGKPKSCDDGSPCTIDVCQLDGACTNKPNMHWDCIPDIVLTAPDRAAQATANTLAETGKLVAPLQKSLAKTLTVQGKDVVPQADGSFAATLALVWGPQTVVTALVDEWGGTRTRIQGVTQSSEWAAPDAPILAARLQGGAADLADALTVTTPYSGQPRAVKWQFALPTSGATWTAQPTPVKALVTAPPGDLGIPLHSACTTVTLDDAPSATPRWQLTADLFNAALRAAWLAGALEDDISPLIADVYPPLTFTGTIHGRAPWQLNACQPGAWTLTLVDLQFDIVGHLGDATFPGQLFMTLTAPADVVLNGGVLELRLGSPVQVTTDVTALPEEFQATDGAVGIAQAGKDKMAPVLVTGWGKTPLVAVPMVGGTVVTLKAGVVIVE